MKRSGVKSSNLESVGYDSASETLEIEFRGGTVYQYSGVPQHAYDAFVGATSLGSHFHHHIRNKYSTMELR